MKKLMMLVVAAAFSVSAAAYACDGMKAAKTEKSGSHVVKKDTTKPQKDTTKKS